MAHQYLLCLSVICLPFKEVSKNRISHWGSFSKVKKNTTALYWFAYICFWWLNIMIHQVDWVMIKSFVFRLSPNQIYQKLFTVRVSRKSFIIIIIKMYFCRLCRGCSSDGWWPSALVHTDISFKADRNEFFSYAWYLPVITPWSSVKNKTSQ